MFSVPIEPYVHYVFLCPLSRTVPAASCLFSIDCFVAHNSKTSPFYVKSILFLFLPLMIFVIPLVIFGAYLVFQRKIRKIVDDGQIPQLKSIYITTIIILLFTVHPDITKQTFSLFSCKKIGILVDDKFLVNDFSQRCGTKTHVAYAVGLGFPMLTFYVFGIPLAGLYLLYLRAKAGELDTIETRQRFSFMSKGYKKERYYWETVIMARKIFLVMISVFFSYDEQVQALMALLLTIVAMSFQIWGRPYEDLICDYLEFGSLFTSFGTFYAGQFLFVPTLEETPGAKVTLSVLIVLLNVIFACIVIYIIGKMILKERADAKASAEREAALKAKQADTAADNKNAVEMSGGDKPADNKPVDDKPKD